jgi:hypothetical protein
MRGWRLARRAGMTRGREPTRCQQYLEPIYTEGSWVGATGGTLSAYEMQGSWPVARPGSWASPVNSDEVRATRFMLTKPRAGAEGYYTAEVYDLLRRVAVELDADRPAGPLIQKTRELVDEAGMPILYTSGSNLYWRASACITFPDGQWLRFPVRGTHRMNAIMTAVDQAGNRVARYRILGRGSVEITVNPDRKLTDELVLAIAISARWLDPYFRIPWGSGV